MVVCPSHVTRGARGDAGGVPALVTNSSSGSPQCLAAARLASGIVGDYAASLRAGTPVDARLLREDT